MKKVLPDGAILVPDNATKVFSGVIFDVYQWPQKMFDGSTKTFEVMRRPDTIDVIAVKDGKFVMIEDEQPHRGKILDFAGGRADEEDESWEAAAKREMLEETGMRFADWRLIYAVQPQPKIEWFGVWYLANEFTDQVAQNVDKGGEKITLVEYEFDDFKELVMSNKMPHLAHYKLLFELYPTLDELLVAPEFKGTEVDR